MPHAVFAVPVLLAVGCGPDPALVAEGEQLSQRVRDLEKENASLEKEADGQAARLRSLERRLSEANSEVALTRAAVDPARPLSATLLTSKGAIRCALWPDKAPETVANFVQLAEGTKVWTDPKTRAEQRRPLYDGTIVHRVIPKFMIQMGDPLGSGKGGPGYQFDDETDNGLIFDRPGLLAMANRGPNTNGSQFFVTDRTKPTHLNGKHTIFGVCEDLDVVEAIATTDKDRRDRPKIDVVLRTIRITRG